MRNILFVKLVFIPVNNECLRKNLEWCQKSNSEEDIYLIPNGKGPSGHLLCINRILFSFVTDFPTYLLYEVGFPTGLQLIFFHHLLLVPGFTGTCKRFPVLKF